MPGSSEQRTENWISTRATITDCTQTRLMQANVLVETYAPPEFVVTFSYLADDRTFEGTYRANSPREVGHDFEILYDPKRPSRNTGSDVLNNRWAGVAAAVVGVLAALLGIWLWGKTDWFQW